LLAGRKTKLAVLALLFSLSALLCQLQYETSRRPESQPVLKMYLDPDGPLHFTSRVLPRTAILAIHRLSGGRLSHEHANALLQLACAWGALLFAFRFAGAYVPPALALAATFLTALFPIWGFVQTGGYYTYPYDFPALLFSTAGLWALARRRHAWLVVFVLAGTLSKESIFWLVPAFCLLHWRSGEPGRWLLTRALLLVAVFAVAYEVPRLLLDPQHAVRVTVQPTGLGEPRWLRNLRSLLLQSGMNPFTNVWYPFFLHLPALLFFTRLHRDIRRLYAATPFFLLPIFMFGNIVEMRLFNEIVPLGALGAVYAFARRWNDAALEQAP
jgi:hypothetical protein